GWDAKSFTRFSGKYLYPLDKVRASVLDPRYPEVREFLISNYVTAVRDWGFDGLKLDFIDRFKPGGKRCEGMDIDTVEDAVERLLSDVTATLRAINPDVLIEFRQPYMGPVISTYGNMLRVWDCPCDAMTNRIASTDLRLITRGCAVHSDMIVWDKDDTDESVALALYSVMFAVPQISVRLEDISESHRAVLLRFLKLWQSERDLLMTGELSARGPDRGYTCITSKLDSRRVTLLVGETVIRLSADITDDIYVNLTGEDTLFVTGDVGDVRYVVTDCRGKTVSRQKKLGKTRGIYVPHTATVRFLR
ncbi:MAG: alpha-galactosidase, partial [Clostridia bacterium]|nr:alpha-galactosidase [Clostridia bacterium]